MKDIKFNSFYNRALKLVPEGVRLWAEFEESKYYNSMAGDDYISCYRIGSLGFTFRQHGMNGDNRTDGPAWVVGTHSETLLQWKKDGMLHRLDGAAYIRSEYGFMSRHYYIDDKQIDTHVVDELLGGQYLDFTPDQTMLFMLTFQ